MTLPTRPPVPIANPVGTLSITNIAVILPILLLALHSYNYNNHSLSYAASGTVLVPDSILRMHYQNH